MAETVVYRHYDIKGKLLYVGIAQDWASRANSHKRNSCWHLAIRSVTLEYFRTRKVAQAAERKAIKTEKPIWNKYLKTIEKENTLTSFSLRIPEFLRTWLVKTATKKGVSANDLVIAILKESHNDRCK